MAFLAINENNGTLQVPFYSFSFPTCFSLDFNLKWSYNKLKKLVFTYTESNFATKLSDLYDVLN